MQSNLRPKLSVITKNVANALEQTDAENINANLDPISSELIEENIRANLEHFDEHISTHTQSPYQLIQESSAKTNQTANCYAHRSQTAPSLDRESRASKT